jgi:hypothetical protein
VIDIGINLKKRSVFMKSTKNLFMAGAALAITLFASVQVSAMEPKVNPYLTEDQKWEIKDQMIDLEEYAQFEFDPKGSLRLPKGHPKRTHRYATDNKRNYWSALNTAELNALKSIYYGNKAYTDREVHETINSYKDQVKLEAFGITNERLHFQ